jgi:hypothetical protein
MRVLEIKGFSQEETEIAPTSATMLLCLHLRSPRPTKDMRALPHNA